MSEVYSDVHDAEQVVDTDVLSGHSHTDVAIAMEKDTAPVVVKPAATLESVEATMPKDRNITFAYKDVSIALNVSSHHTTGNKKPFHRVKDMNGVIRPGTLTLILAPPGHGKSGYMKALGNLIQTTSGHFAVNGRSYAQAEKEGCDVGKLTQYVDQVDSHMALLTVQETIDFAHKMSCHEYSPQRVQDTIELLGLTECKDTILGSDFLRGVSGGQRRRVTIGEMLVSDACLLLLDEPTNGLDTATSEDILRGLRQWCRDTNGSIVCTLQQPTPGLYATFDDIILLREGETVYHGPRDDLLTFVEGMGYVAPDDVDTCDYLIDFLSQPRVVLHRQREDEEGRKATRRRNKEQHEDEQEDEEEKNRKRNLSLGSLTLSDGSVLARSATPCVSIESMVAFYQSTSIWKAMEAVLDVTFPKVGSADLSHFPVLLPTPKAKLMYSPGSANGLFDEFLLVLSRHCKLIFRDKQLIFPRIFNITLMGLIYGSLYYDIDTSAFFLRVACLLISVVQISFGNMVEVPIAVAYTRVVLKQMAAHFYSSWSYVLAAAVTSIPLFLAEVIIFINILYWMCNNYADASCYFLHIMIVIAQSFNMSIWFRFLSSLAKDEASAQALVAPSAGVFMMFGGFFVTIGNIPDWMVWLYWISPFSWSVRALANIEFLSDRYNTQLPSGITLGEQYLEELDMKIGTEWVWYALIYQLAVTIILLGVHAITLRRSFYEASIGTRRTDDEEVVEGFLDTEGQGMQAITEAEQEEQVEISVVRDASSFNNAGLKTLREALPFNPTWLSFSNIKYTVQVMNSEGQHVDKVLLDGVHGYAEPGKLTALMGASGAGKTTILDVVAGRKSMGTIEGNIMFNGRAATANDYANVTGYVEQFDSLFAFSTVRETLEFAAKLRLPASVPAATKEKIVDEVLEILELSSIADYLIGNNMVAGLSPSQLKRVNIGVELVANPSVLYLDEPTTGLDSKSAQIVMRVVRRIARSGRAVVCTIHQPSAELFYLFDRLLLLGSGGHQMYFGDLGSRSSRFIKYMEGISGVSKILPRYNPASWMLEEIGVGVASLKEHVGDGPRESQGELVQRFKKTYFASRTFRRTEARLKALETLSGVEDSIEYSVSRTRQEESNDTLVLSTSNRNNDISRTPSYSVAELPINNANTFTREETSIWTQFTLLFARNFVGYWRNPPLLLPRMFVTTFISVLFGCVYFNLQLEAQSDVVSNVGALTMPIVFGCFIHAGTALPSFLANRAVFYRERACKMYNPGLWALVSMLTELFYVIWSTFTLITPLYFLIGAEPDAALYFKYAFTAYLCGIVYIALALLLAAVCPSGPVAQVVLSMIFGILMTFNGVAITANSIPKGWKWLFRVLPLSHATECLVMPQFKDSTTVITVQGVPVPLKIFVENYLGMGYTAYWENMGWVVLFILATLILGFIATHKLVFNNR